MTAQQAIEEARSRGIVLTPAGATLRFLGPKGALSEELKRTAIKEAEVLLGEAEIRAEKILDAAHRRSTQ